jgi:hypothetical protein
MMLPVPHGAVASRGTPAAAAFLPRLTPRGSLLRVPLVLLLAKLEHVRLREVRPPPPQQRQCRELLHEARHLHAPEPHRAASGSARTPRPMATVQGPQRQRQAKAWADQQRRSAAVAAIACVASTAASSRQYL